LNFVHKLAIADVRMCGWMSNVQNADVDAYVNANPNANPNPDVTLNLFLSVT